MLKKLTASVIAMAIFTTGCASIVSKSSYPITIDSTPEASYFAIYNEAGEKIHTGKTPSRITLEAGDSYFSKAHYTLKYKKKGYQEQTIKVTPYLDGWFYGNLVFGGLVGVLIVDPLTGAMYKLPEAITVNLSKSKSAKLENQTITFMFLDDVHPNQRKNLVKVN